MVTSSSHLQPLVIRKCWYSPTKRRNDFEVPAWTCLANYQLFHMFSVHHISFISKYLPAAAAVGTMNNAVTAGRLSGTWWVRGPWACNPETSLLLLLCQLAAWLATRARVQLPACQTSCLTFRRPHVFCRLLACTCLLVLVPSHGSGKLFVLYTTPVGKVNGLHNTSSRHEDRGGYRGEGKERQI